MRKTPIFLYNGELDPYFPKNIVKKCNDYYEEQNINDKNNFSTTFEKGIKHHMSKNGRKAMK